MNPAKILHLLIALTSLSIVAGIGYEVLSRLSVSTGHRIAFLKGYIGAQFAVIVISAIILFSKSAAVIGSLLPSESALNQAMSTVRTMEINGIFGQMLFLKILCISYLLGLAMVVGWILFTYLKMRRLLLESRPFSDTQSNTRISKRCHSPFSFGFLNPQIFIPDAFRNFSNLPVIIKHEQTHLQFHDPQWKLISLLNRSLQYFNPLAYYLHKKFELEMEIRCDSETIKQTKISTSAYGNILIDTTVQLQNLKPNPLFSYMSETNLKRRITAMKDVRSTSRLVTLMTYLFLGTATATATAVASGIYKDSRQVYVHAKIYLNGKLLSNPGIRTLMNEPAQMKMTTDIPSQLKWGVIASDSKRPQVPNGIELETELEYSAGDLHLYSKPYIVVTPGDEAIVQIGENNGNTLELRVIAERL